MDPWLKVKYLPRTGHKISCPLVNQLMGHNKVDHELVGVVLVLVLKILHVEAHQAPLLHRPVAKEGHCHHVHLWKLVLHLYPYFRLLWLILLKVILVA